MGEIIVTVNKSAKVNCKSVMGSTLDAHAYHLLLGIE